VHSGVATKRRRQRAVPHACWGNVKIIFTSEHIMEIARLSEILPGKTGTAAPNAPKAAPKEPLIGTRASVRLAPVK
jgi:hypothetical protein